jgi:protein SCO1/2
MSRRLAAPLALLLLGPACSQAATRHAAHGVVVDVQPEIGQVVIAHDDIPGLMPAMTMNFDVPAQELLAALAKGQRIDFTVEFTGRAYRVVEARVLGTGASPDTPGLAGLAGLREPAPAFELVDQEGREISLADLRGRALVVDFVYSECPGPCPILTSAHVSLQRALPPALRERVWFVSISLDPARDTPQALRRYAEARGADLSRWSFLTGDAEEVARVVRAFGVGSLRRPDGEIDHRVVTFLVDAEGRIAERYVGLEHEPEEILRDLERIAAG